MANLKPEQNFLRRQGPILAIAIFCFLLHRIAFPFLTNSYPRFFAGAYWRTDVDGWSAVGEHLLEGKGYRSADGEITAERGPVFPLYLASIYWMFGVKRGRGIALTMQMVLEAVNCWLIYLLACKLSGRKSAGLLAALIWAIHPLVMLIDMYLYSEPLFTLILLLFSLSLLDLIDKFRPPQFFLTGVWLGLATLCRPITQYFPIILTATLIWMFRRRFKEVLKGALILLAGFWLILSPWVVRNYIEFKKFVPGSTLLGYNWYFSLIRMQKPDYLEVTEFYDPREINKVIKQELSAQGISLAGKNEAERDEIYRSQAWRTIKKYPWKYFKVCLNRMGIVLFNIDSQGYSRLRSLAVTLIQAALFSLALAAFIFYIGKWADYSLPLLALIAYNTLAYSAILGSWRFTMPVMPYVIIWASLGLHGLYKHNADRFKRNEKV